MSSRGRGYGGYNTRGSYSGRGTGYRGSYRGGRGSYEGRGGRGGYSSSYDSRYNSGTPRYQSNRDRIDDSYKKPYRSVSPLPAHQHKYILLSNLITLRYGIYFLSALTEVLLKVWTWGRPQGPLTLLQCVIIIIMCAGIILTSCLLERFLVSHHKALLS